MSASYLLKTGLTASTATSYTVSMWVKFTKTSFPSSSPYLWSCGASGSGAQGLYMNNSSMKLSYYGHTSYGSGAISDGALRDLSGWYHFVWSVNSGTGTLYLNGVQQSASISNVAPLNAHGGTEMAVHTYCGGTYSTYDDAGALMSHVHFIDGTAYNASTFGSTDATTGEWKINTSPSVTYGTNGFFLLKDDNAVTDRSGQGNNFTSSGTITKTEDCPSNVFCTINKLDSVYVSCPITNGNNTVNMNNTNERYVMGTLGMNSGKYYWEAKIDARSGDTYSKFGIESIMKNGVNGYEPDSYGYRGEGGGKKVNNGNFTNWGNSYTTGDILGCAVDLDNNKIYFSKNGTWQESGDPTSGSTGTGAAFTLGTPSSGFYFPSVGKEDADTIQWSFNFGNGYFGTTAVSSAGTNASGIGIFEYDVPAGYTALCTKGLNE